MSIMSEELKDRVNIHHKVLFGDPENMKEMPGVIAEQARMSFEQGRTNEILTEVRDSLSKINWLLISAFVLAIIGLVFKNLPTL